MGYFNYRRDSNGLRLFALLVC
jgi:hypothetical protein